MTALPNRILRQLAASPTALTSEQLRSSFAAYMPASVDLAIARLVDHHLVVELPNHAWQLTPAGRTAAALPRPPRWSGPRKAPQRGPIAR